MPEAWEKLRDALLLGVGCFCLDGLWVDAPFWRFANSLFGSCIFGGEAAVLSHPLLWQQR